MMRKSHRIILTLLLAALVFSAFFTLKAGAEGGGFDFGGFQTGNSTEPASEPEPTGDITFPTEPDTFPPETAETYPEPTHEPGTEPVETYPAPTQPTSEAATLPPVQFSTGSPQNEYFALISDASEPTNFIAPPMDKSVSTKTYTTDYTAGIVSWICVAVGVVVIIVMLVSTKLTGRGGAQRRI